MIQQKLAEVIFFFYFFHYFFSLFVIFIYICINGIGTNLVLDFLTKASIASVQQQIEQEITDGMEGIEDDKEERKIDVVDDKSEAPLLKALFDILQNNQQKYADELKMNVCLLFEKVLEIANESRKSLLLFIITVVTPAISYWR